MKLNAGSSCTRGIYKKDDSWVNLDIVKSRGVNTLGDILRLPFKDDSFEVIHCVHVLEHLTRDRHLPALQEFLRVLKPNGECYVEVPDFQATIHRLAAAYERDDKTAIHIWRTSIYGKTERPGMAHHFGFDAATLGGLFFEAGFGVVTLRDEMISPHYLQEPVLLIRGMK
jgi:predicted SAM-dependent methyltransferase